VRSYGNNIAVNVWWKHHLDSHVDVDECLHHRDNVIDQTLTLDKVTVRADNLDSDDTQSLRSQSVLHNTVMHYIVLKKLTG